MTQAVTMGRGLAFLGCQTFGGILSVTMSAAVCAAGELPAADTVAGRYERAVRFADAGLSDLVHNAAIAVQWFPDGERLWYRRQQPQGAEFVLVDARRGTRGPAFDHGAVAAFLEEAAGTPCSAGSLPFGRLEFVPGQPERVCVLAGWRRWHIVLGTGQCSAAPTDDGGEPDVPEANTAAGPAAAKAPAAERSWRVLIEDHNLVLEDVATGARKPLTRDGTAAEFYTNPSPCPGADVLAVWRSRRGAHLSMTLLESVPSEGLRPRTVEHEYDLPGDPVDTHELWLFDVATGSGRAAAVDRIDWWGPPGLRWCPDGVHFTYEQTYRGFQRRTVVRVHAVTGEARVLIDERSETFLPPGSRMARYLDASREILWASERDGWRHLYRIDAESGAVKNRVTSGPWVVRGIADVDEERREVLIQASGREPDRDPYLVHWYRVGLDGAGLLCLTPGDGQHEVTFSPDRRYYIDHYSRVDLPPVTELRRTSDGGLVCELERADDALLRGLGWRRPEPFAARGRDGRTDIWGVIYRPSFLDTSARYPVIEDIYAGPHGSFVPKVFDPAWQLHALCELGFVVVKIDGMGTANRSKAFHDVAWHNLADSGFPDRIAWLREAAARYPHMDVERVGIFGHSAGGYNAARALIDHPEVYKVAVSLSGNHDHRTDKAWWNELWMGYPLGPHYEEQSNVTQAHRLRGRLLLVHGELDRNVNPGASTLRFLDALIRADRDADLLLVPGAGHGFPGEYVTRRRWDYFVRHLRGEEPPPGFRIPRPRGNGGCRIAVRNALDVPFELYWIDFEGKAKKYADIAPGAEHSQHTYYGHRWQARRGDRLVDEFSAAPGDLRWLVDGRATRPRE
ncbi:MAG: prolyl oligopeptidase family serine peptidase [Lentisphaeria bacterium]|nr:prolyl oligopeptidase family serine peptidase [Lentisphaeria bacterium]